MPLAERPCVLAETVCRSVLILKELLLCDESDVIFLQNQYHVVVDQIMCQSFGWASGGSELAFLHVFLACYSHS